MKNSDIKDLISRYAVLLILGVFNFSFYLIFTPLTVYPVFWLTSLLDSNAALLGQNLFFFKGIYFEIIPACVAGAAYYLLLILNLSTSMKLKKRIKSLLFLLIWFLIINIIRIVYFANLAASGSSYFDISHLLFWYLGSTILVAIIWFANVKIFKINNVPIYSDVSAIIHDVKRKKKAHKEK